MPMLGDVLAAARRSAGEFESWLGGADAQLAATARQAAAASGVGLAGYARMAVVDFSRFANDEDWASLVSGLRNTPDPGRACLTAMVRWRLAAGCPDHSGLPNHPMKE